MRAANNDADSNSASLTQELSRAPLPLLLPPAASYTPQASLIRPLLFRSLLAACCFEVALHSFYCLAQRVCAASLRDNRPARAK